MIEIYIFGVAVAYVLNISWFIYETIKQIVFSKKLTVTDDIHWGASFATLWIAPIVWPYLIYLVFFKGK